MSQVKEILKALRSLDKPDIAYGYKGVYMWRTENIGRDAADLIDSLTAENEAMKAELDKRIHPATSGWKSEPQQIPEPASCKECIESGISRLCASSSGYSCPHYKTKDGIHRE